MTPVGIGSRVRMALRRATPLPMICAVALTAGLVLALLLARGATWPVRVYAVGLAATCVWLMASVIRFAGDDPWPAGRPAPLAMEVLDRPRELGELESAVLFAQNGALDFHYRVRPLLRSLAADLLAVRRGIDLEAEPDAARDALGLDAFTALQPPTEPIDREARGVRFADLESLVAALEAL